MARGTSCFNAERSGCAAHPLRRDSAPMTCCTRRVKSERGAYMAIQQSAISRAPRPSSLADVLDLILDKGLVIDAYVRVSVVGIEILTIDARVVVASVDTYLRFAEAVNRLDLTQTREATTFQELTEGKASGHAEDKGR